MKLSSYRCLRCEDRKWVCAEHEFEPWHEEEEEGECVIFGGPAARLARPSCSAVQAPDLPASLMQYRAPVGPLDGEPTNDVVWKCRIR
jgi:hypothetical protein